MTATHIRHLRRVILQWQIAHRSVIERIREDEAEQRKKNGLNSIMRREINQFIQNGLDDLQQMTRPIYCADE